MLKGVGTKSKRYPGMLEKDPFECNFGFCDTNYVKLKVEPIQ